MWDIDSEEGSDNGEELEVFVFEGGGGWTIKDMAVREILFAASSESDYESDADADAVGHDSGASK